MKAIIKLSKLFAGEYELNTKIDGCAIKVQASYGECMKGFSVSYFVNNTLIFEDGFSGMTLRIIKQGLENNVYESIEEYKNKQS